MIGRQIDCHTIRKKQLHFITYGVQCRIKFYRITKFTNINLIVLMTILHLYDL
jgi:hypothetical protein